MAPPYPLVSSPGESDESRAKSQPPARQAQGDRAFTCCSHPFLLPRGPGCLSGVLLRVTPQSCQVASQRGLKVDPPDASERWGPGPHAATRVSWSPSWEQMAQPGLLPGTVASLCGAQVLGPLPLRLLGVFGVGHRAWASQVLAVGLNDGGDASAPSPGLCDEGVWIHPCRTNK